MMAELRPIRSDADHAAALVEVERLWGARSGTSDGDRLDILATLIDAYEALHHAIDPADPIEAIRFRMEHGGRTPSDLAALIGSEEAATELLEGRSELSLGQIRRLHDDWGLPADLLIRPLRPRDAA